MSAGYGLAVAKELIDKLGGTIGRESTLGQGSRFWVQLPASEGSRGPDPNSPGLPQGAGGAGPPTGGA
jgi:signal transduction histidine kinase